MAPEVPPAGTTSVTRALAGVAQVTAAAVAVVAVLMITSLVRRSSEAVEAVSPTVLAVAAAGSMMALAGAGFLAVSRHRDVTLLSATASLLVLVAVLALFSIGILVLPIAVVMLVILGRRTSGHTSLAAPLLAGATLATGLVVLFAIWVQPPLVRCLEHGASTTSRPWWGISGGSYSGSGTAGAGGVSPTGAGVATGSMETSSGRYVYRCEGRKLVEFQRTRKG